MSQEDLYSILHIAPTAGNAEIKKAYRRLAMQFHPDKYPDSSLNTEQFRRVTEAYKILSNPTKRKAYHQKKYPGHFYNRKALNTQEILTELSKIKLFIKAEGQNSIDYYQVERKIAELLNNQNLFEFQSETDLDLRKKIVQEVLECCNYLEYPMIISIIPLLNKIADSEEAVLIASFLTIKKYWYYWDKYKIIAAILIAAIICFLIYRLGY